MSKRKKKILFVQHIVMNPKDPLKEVKIYYQIGKYLKERDNNIDIVHLCRDKPTRNYLNQRGEKTYFIEDILRKYPIDNLKLQAYYKRLEYKSIDLRLLGRIGIKYAPRIPLEKIFKESIKYLYAFEEYLTEEKVDCVVSSVGYTLIKNSLGIMARELGIPTLYFSGGLISGTTLEENFYKFRDELKNIPLKPLTEKEKIELKNFTQRFTQRKEIIWKTKKYGLLKRILTGLRVRYIHFSLSSPKLGIESRFDMVSRSFIYILKFLKPYLARSYYTPLKDIKDKNYIFFPMQIPRDFSLPVLYPGYDSMEYTVDLFSKALPEGYLLAVKEHPHESDIILIDELRRIKNKNNVVLLRPEENPHDVIKNSSAVVAINGSSGWLAMMYHKPVVVFNDSPYETADVFYSSYGCTINVKNPENLAEAFKKAVNTEVDRDKIDSFIYHILYKKSKEFCPIPPPESYQADDISHNEIKILAEYFFKKLKDKHII